MLSKDSAIASNISPSTSRHMESDLACIHPADPRRSGYKAFSPKKSEYVNSHNNVNGKTKKTPWPSVWTSGDANILDSLSLGILFKAFQLGRMNMEITYPSAVYYRKRMACGVCNAKLNQHSKNIWYQMMSSWWFQPISKILVNLDDFPK